MTLSFLIIFYRDEEYISLHENEAQAWARLLNFVENTCALNSESSVASLNKSEEERVATFFAGAGDAYVIGNADASEVETHIDAVIREKTPCSGI